MQKKVSCPDIANGAGRRSFSVGSNWSFSKSLCFFTSQDIHKPMMHTLAQRTRMTLWIQRNYSVPIGHYCVRSSEILYTEKICFSPTHISDRPLELLLWDKLQRAYFHHPPFSWQNLITLTPFHCLVLLGKCSTACTIYTCSQLKMLPF